MICPWWWWWHARTTGDGGAHGGGYFVSHALRAPLRNQFRFIVVINEEFGLLSV